MKHLKKISIFYALQRRDQRNYYIYNENKNTYIECVLQVEKFNKTNLIWRNRLCWFWKIKELASLQIEVQEVSALKKEWIFGTEKYVVVSPSKDVLSKSAVLAKLGILNFAFIIFRFVW